MIETHTTNIFKSIRPNSKTRSEKITFCFVTTKYTTKGDRVAEVMRFDTEAKAKAALKALRHPKAKV